jgi:hypothetical protein
MGYEQIKLKQKNAAPGARRFKAGSQSLITPLQSPIMQHYRNMGNEALQRMMEAGVIQAKLKMGQPNDKYEQEADRVADQVMRMPEPKQSLVNGHSSLVQRESTRPECREDVEGIQTKPITQQITPIIQRQSSTEEEEKPLWCEPKEEEEPPMCTEEEEELEPEPTVDSTDIESIETGDAAAGPIDISEEEELYRKKQDGGNVNNPGPGLQNQIHSLKGGGHTLPKSVRSYFEPRFGADFSRVRVHNDSQAAHAARSLNARAFTIGRDMVFGARQYSPGSLAGKKLMAHELTHVVQQNPATGEKHPIKPGHSMELQKDSILNREIIQLQPDIRPPLPGMPEPIEVCGFHTTKKFRVNTGTLTVTCKLDWKIPGCALIKSYYITPVKKKGPRPLIAGNIGKINKKRYPVGSSHTETWTGLDPGEYYLEIHFSSKLRGGCCLSGTINIQT